MYKPLIHLVACAVVGCASANQGDTAADVIDPDAGATGSDVEMIVINRTSSTVMVFAEWLTGGRVRLGQVGGGGNHRVHHPISE